VNDAEGLRRHPANCRRQASAELRGFAKLQMDLSQWHNTIERAGRFL
jgi:hypothetical protein